MNFGEQNMMRKLNEMEKIEQTTGTDAKHPTVKDDLFARQEQKGKQEETSENERLQTKEEKGNEETQKNDKGETPNELKSQTEQTENPFNISPDVFEVTESNGVSTQGEAESKMTEPSEPSTTASVEKIAPVPSEVPTSPTFVEEVQPLPDSFVPPKGPCPTPNDQLDNNRSDVLFLLDSSSSFNENKFKHAIQLIVETVQNFNNFGPDGLQISLVQYNSEPYLEFSLRKHNCKNFLIDDIFDTEYMQGSNMLGKALEKVSKFAFTKKRGDRADAENILIIVTDGESDDKVQQPVEVARQNNVTVLVVASLEANPNHLSDLTGLKDNVFHLGKETAVPLSHKLANRIAMISAEHFYSTLIPTLENKDKVHVVSGVEDENINVVQETDEQQASTKVIQSVIHESHESHGIVGLKCFSNGFKVTLNLPPSFEGVALIKGYGELEQCRKEIASSSDAARSVEFFVSSGSCGMARVKSLEPPGYNSSLILYLIHNRALITGEDKAYLLQCFYGLSTDYSEVMTNLDVLKGDIMLAETISLSSIPPTCSYSIRRDSPHGPIISKAVVGQTVFHRWDCDGGEEANNVYGIQVHNCYASDDVEEKFPIIDNRGCSSDLAILSDPTYSEDRLTAFAQSRAFGFLDTDSLKFICKLSLCTRDGDGCEGITPPSCGPNSSDLLLTRRIRHQNSALESALTSALSTKVGVTMTGPSVFQQRIIELGLSKFTWMLVAATFAVAIGTVILTRFARAPSDSTTTYSDPESGILEDSIPPFQPHVSMEALTISHPTDNGYKPHFDILHRSTDPRLMEFMKDFDRSKYI